MKKKCNRKMKSKNYKKFLYSFSKKNNIKKTKKENKKL